LDFVLPGDPETPTGGYAYDRRMLRGLRELGWDVELHRLEAGFPNPSPGALADAAGILAGIPTGRTLLLDGLAMGAMPEVVGTEAGRLRLIALVHHPLAEETGLSEERAAALRAAERRALAAARQVVVTSRYTAGLVAGLGVAPERIRVVEPGTDPAPLARGSALTTLNLLCVASLTHRKGHSVLLDALADLKDRDWQLTCAGSLSQSPATADALQEQIARLGLGGRVALAGELSVAALAELYHSADLFVLATRFEGYGMALAEALARGLPVVSTRTGAVTETVPKEAGLLVAPNEPRELAAALAVVMDDPGLRRRLALGARAARNRLPRWKTAVRRMAEVVRAAGA
jgi:glycosyltransferase involved in cell wall biosynthesis